MRPFSVVPEKPVHKTVVERSDIIPQKRTMVSQELLIERAVETFHMRIHLRRTRIGVEVSDTEIVARGREVEREL